MGRYLVYFFSIAYFFKKTIDNHYMKKTSRILLLVMRCRPLTTRPKETETRFVDENAPAANSFSERMTSVRRSDLI